MRAPLLGSGLVMWKPVADRLDEDRRAAEQRPGQGPREMKDVGHRQVGELGRFWSHPNRTNLMPYQDEDEGENKRKCRGEASPPRVGAGLMSSRPDVDLEVGVVAHADHRADIIIQMKRKRESSSVQIQRGISSV